MDLYGALILMIMSVVAMPIMLAIVYNIIRNNTIGHLYYDLKWRLYKHLEKDFTIDAEGIRMI